MLTDPPAEIDEIWAGLIATDVSGETMLYRRVLPGSPCDVFVGVEKPRNQLAVFIEVGAKALEHVGDLPQADGVRIDPVPLGEGRRRRVRFVVSASAAAYHDVFRVLGRDVVASLASASGDREGVDRVLDRVRHWQAFLRRPSSEHLDRKAQQGLYGELLTLQGDLIPAVGAEVAVAAWMGPAGSNQDFQLGATAVETKTSAANSHQMIHVSDARQLDTAGLSELYLQLWSLDVRRGTDATLPHLVAAIRAGLAAHPASARVFDARLLEAGYRDSHSEDYSTTTYAVRQKHTFLCGPRFPRIDPTQLPEGVGGVKYSIELAACGAFSVAESDFRDAIGALRNG